MENASKALIIAGAILIAILLISVAVIIINSTGNMQRRVQTSSDTMEIQTFNSNFTTYEGDAVSASQVKALMSLIKSSNAANGFNKAESTMTADEKKADKFVYLDSTGKTKSTDLKNNKTYTVEVSDYSSGGYVNKITITEN